MPSTEILEIVTGISSFLGLAGLVTYLYFSLQLRRAEFSIRGLVQGENLFNAEQALKILSQFTDDASRLEALKSLTTYDTVKASALLGKIKNNVDVAALTKITSKNYRQMSLTTGVFFLIIASISFAYTVKSTGQVPSAEPPSGESLPETKVAGTVVDSNSKIAIKQAQVSDVSSGTKVYSDNNGSFSLAFKQNLRIRVEKGGYESVELSVNGPTDALIVQLHPK